MPTFSQIFQLFLLNGFKLVGNSYTTIEQQVVGDEEGCISQKEFMDIVTLCQAFPGVFALNFSAYLGHRLLGLKGSIAALLGTTVPAFIALTVLAIIVSGWEGSGLVNKFLHGVRPAVLALLVYPCYKLGRDNKVNLSNIFLPVAAAVAIWLLHVSPGYIVVGAALLGYIYGRFVKPYDK